VSLTSRPTQPLSGAEECALKSEDVFKECDACPEMVVVPAGRFTMGSPNNDPERTASDTVTRGEFATFVTASGHKVEGGYYAYMGGNKWILQADCNWRSPDFPQDDRHPVTCSTVSPLR
jgi:formylglycine-generating enzyme required for sulfatase activity